MASGGIGEKGNRVRTTLGHRRKVEYPGQPLTRARAHYSLVPNGKAPISCIVVVIHERVPHSSVLLRSFWNLKSCSCVKKMLTDDLKLCKATTQSLHCSNARHHYPASPISSRTSEACVTS
jgi:hypothetical protein